jgi:hypothetical protein
MPGAERIESADPVPELAREEQRQQPDGAKANTVRNDPWRSNPGGLGGARPHPRLNEANDFEHISAAGRRTHVERGAEHLLALRGAHSSWKRMERSPHNAFAFHNATTALTPNDPAAQRPRLGIARRADPPVTWISVAARP